MHQCGICKNVISDEISIAISRSIPYGADTLQTIGGGGLRNTWGGAGVRGEIRWDALPCWGASNQIIGPSLLHHTSIQQAARAFHSKKHTCTLLT